MKNNKEFSIIELLIAIGSIAWMLAGILPEISH